MKIFLVYPVINSPQNRGYNYGLGYIASVLKEGNHSVDYITLKDERDIPRFYEKINEKKPDIIGFSATTTQFAYLGDIAKTIKEISNSFIVCGGVHPTLKPECILEIPELDAITRGEGEFPMLELANAFENNEDYLNIKNFWFREKDKIVKNDVRPLIKNLDELPFPDKDSLDYQKVIDDYLGPSGINCYIFSRGCTFDCSYCCNKALSSTYPDKHNYFRQRSPEKAIEEIEIDASKYKFGFIYFDDDTLSLNKKWFYEFFTLYKEKFDYPFGCNLRVGTVDSDMFRLLKEAGAKEAWIGIEHGNEKFRKTILKREMSNKQIINTFKLCGKHAIESNGFIMVGFPFETKELFFDTVRLCRRVLARGISSIFHPYPCTELGIICEKNNWLPDKKYFREREEAVISYPNFTKEEIQLCADVFPVLIRFKFIPLKTPLRLVPYIDKFVKYTQNIHMSIPSLIEKTGTLIKR